MVLSQRWACSVAFTLTPKTKAGCRSNASKSVSKDPLPKSSQFNAEHYATLVAYPAPFHKYPEPFLCVIGISRNYTLDEDTYPQFLRENGEGGCLLCSMFMVLSFDYVVWPFALFFRNGFALFYSYCHKGKSWGGSGEQGEHGDSVGGDQNASIQFVSECAETIVEDVAPVRPRHPKKRKTVVVDSGEPSHPAKKVEIAALPTQPFVTSSVSVTPEHEDSSHHSGANVAEAEVDSIVRSSVSVMTVATTVTATTNPAVVTKEKVVKPSLFSADSTSAGGTDPAMGGFTDLTVSDLLVGGIRTVVDPDSNIQKVYVPQWSVTNGSRLDDGHVCREMVDEFAPPKFFASVRGMEHDQLFAEFNVGAARQISLSAEVRMRAEYNIRERRKLKSIVEEKDTLLKAKDEEIESLKAQLLVKEAEAAEAISLRAEASELEAIKKFLQAEVRNLKDHNVTLEKEKNELNVKVTDLAASVKVREQEVADLNAQVIAVKSHSDNLVGRVHELEASSAGLQEKVTAYEDFIDQLEKFQDEKMEEVNEKFDKLCADFVEMALHLKEKFYPHLLTTISGSRWLLTHGMELAIAKCLNSTEYLSILRATIGKAVEKGMQEGLSAGITHGTEGRQLTDIAAYNPSAEADYLSALQRLHSVNFSLIVELKSNKDDSVDTIMNLLHLDDTLAERLDLTELQPHVDQLMVPIHHSPDQRVIGASALSLSLDVSSSRVLKIKENIANDVSALRGVFVPLSEPLSAAALKGTESTAGSAPGTATALSVTFDSVITIPPISTDDYEIAGAGDQATAVGNVANEDTNHFSNVDDAELNVPE
ncbi:hypothetical protein Tco_0487357 [Tanacetum coccineum]